MQIKIMSLNLRFDKPDLGNNAWIYRREAVAALISEYSPDVVGTQEGKAHQLLDLHRLLPDYQSVGRDRDGNGTGERCAIFYRHQHLKCLETGDFCLSTEPEQLGYITPEWENTHPRMVTWAVFALAGVERTIKVFNTHLDFKSAKARELGAELIWQRLGKLNLSDSWLFLTGDFNTKAGTLPRDTFLLPMPNSIQLQDAIANFPPEQQMTYHEFTGKGFDAVDTVYYDSRVTLQAVKIDSTDRKGIWPSDHFPVIAEFKSS